MHSHEEKTYVLLTGSIVFENAVILCPAFQTVFDNLTLIDKFELQYFFSCSFSMTEITCFLLFARNHFFISSILQIHSPG